MKAKKRFFAISLLLVVVLVLAGCTPNQMAILDASVKMQNVNSVQQNMTMSMNLKGSGLDPELQEQVDQIAAMLNGAKIGFDIKTDSNEKKTVVRAQADMKFSMPGLEINMPFWIDMDLEQDNPKFLEIFQMPSIVRASMPPEYMTKDYMVMDLNGMNESGLNSMDMTKLMDFSVNLQTKWTDFLLSYAARFNPDVEVVSVPVDEPSTQKYTISLDDKAFKGLLGYTVNHFLQDAEARNFISEYFQAIFELTPDTGVSGDSMFFEEAFMEPQKLAEALTAFNAILESLQDVTLIGEGGIQLSYTIKDGYITQNSGSIDLQLDLAQIAAWMEEPEEVSGVLNLVINFDSETSNINEPLDIRIPELTAENSYDYVDFIKTSMAAMETGSEQVESTPGQYTVQPGDTLATIALNHYGSYDRHAAIYQANLTLFKNNNNRLDAGMVLTLPAEGLLAPLPTQDIKQVYTVKAGDTLATIAQQVYGDGSLYTKIYEANKERLKSPNLIYTGQWLAIPN